MSAQQQHINTSSSSSTSFGSGADADLAARLTAPVSPTTEKASAEARRRTSEWAPPTSSTRQQPPAPLGRAFSFDREDHKHAMMAASGALSAGDGPASSSAGAGAQGFTERA